MLHRNKVLGLTAAIAGALGLGMSGAAHATAWAVASQQITGGSVTFSNPGAVSNINGTNSSNTSAAVGSVSDGASVTAPRGTPTDARCAHVGIACAENAFADVTGTPGNWGLADAQIISEQLLPGGSFNASGIAEARIDTTGVGFGNSGNGSTTGFVLNFVTGATQNLTFTFSDTAFERAFVNTQGGSATANIGASFSLTGNGSTLRWAPDGVANNVAVQNVAFCSGGVTCSDTSDPFNLNGGVNAGPAPGGVVALNQNGTWTLVISNLAPGSYSLDLEMTETARVSNAVPEPGTLAIAGLGLGLLGFGVRRNRKS